MSRSRRKAPFSGVTGAASDRPFKAVEHGRERAATRKALAQGAEPPCPKAFGDPWRGEKDGKLYQPGRPDVLRK
jgi:hypothetical protein